MFRSRYHVCDLFGIPINITSSFIVLLVLFVLDFGSFSYGLAIALVLALSVTLHELAHALTARAFGYRTRDITLSLLGGCASMIALPRKASQEFLVALAGPLMSFALAGGVLLFDVLGIPVRNNFLRYVLGYAFWMNVMLGGFNLLPGFPMDGGRVFRSFARLFTSRVKATWLAMVVGRVAAVLLVFGPALGIHHIWIIPIGGNFFMRALIAWMIWQEGYREYAQALAEGEWGGRWDFSARVSPPPYGGDEDETEVRRGR